MIVNLVLDKRKDGKWICFMNELSRYATGVGKTKRQALDAFIIEAQRPCYYDPYAPLNTLERP